MPSPLPILPIDAVLPALLTTLRSGTKALLTASPGAGKTTRVPLALHDAGFTAQGRVLMLEPRRLAARRAAEYMASLLGEEPGGTVGYRIRGESRAGPGTRIEVVTEGILTRMFQESPELPGISVLLFDEFHERSIHADLGLAFALDVQETLRPDMRILIMSATLDGVGVSRILGDPPVITAEGRAYPVQTTFLEFPPAGSIEQLAARTIVRALQRDEGDMLVFLPGRRELRRCQEHLIDAGVAESAHIHLLHSDTPPQEQRLALAPADPQNRRVILATSVAETSLTIDGVRIVVDSGLARVPRFEPRRGMTGLVTVPVSRAAAEQRRGRAGRQAPGVCYRLWTEEQHAALPEFATPEILEADLAPLALDLARWGSPDGSSLRFLDPPPLHHLAQARALLKDLGTLDDHGRLTPHGTAIGGFPVHPRLAHMILRARERRLEGVACDIAAILEGPPIRRRGAGEDVDLDALLYVLRTGDGCDRHARSRVLDDARRLRRLVEARPGSDETEEPGVLLALAYPERVARRRAPDSRRYLLANGTGALLPPWSLLARHEFLAVGDVDGAGTEVKIFLASPVAQERLGEAFADTVIEEDETIWDEQTGSIVCRRLLRLGAVTLLEKPGIPDGKAAAALLVEAIRNRGIERLPWTATARALRERGEWLRLHGNAGDGWPDLSDGHLISTLEEWLAPFLDGMTRLSHLERLDMHAVVSSLLTHNQLRTLDREVPTHLATPAGRRVPIDYASGAQPVASVRLQEMFGEREAPVIGGGKMRVLLQLLSPAQRPLAVTSDLASFWKNVYPEVRKQMRGRYPKHPWPEDPLAAKPTASAKKRAR